MKKLTGSIVALVTPFHEDGSVDFARLRELCDWHIANGTDAILALGTTGETASTSLEEDIKTLECVIDHVNGRVPVIAGAGSNSSEMQKHKSVIYSQMGASALLCISPYYVKTNEEGMYRHFMMSADAATAPIILYNVPGRTGIGIKPSTYKALSKHPNIVGVKEASGNIAEYSLPRSMCGADLVFWSGNDSDTVAMMALGAKGVISVASNIIPADVARLCELCLAGDFKAATEQYFKLADFFDKLFIETNPIPVKTAMNLAGMNVGKFRLPLVDMAEDTKAKLIESMHGVGLKTV